MPMALDADRIAEELHWSCRFSPWRDRIPGILRTLKQRLAGESKMRLSSV